MVAFSSNNRKKNSGSGYPKVKLEAGQRARVAIVDEEPVAVYVHNLEAVIVDEYGSPVMKEIKFKNGGTKQVPDTTFVAAYRCQGDYDTCESNGSDPDNCVMCEAASNPETAAAFKVPDRKFAIHVLDYKLNPNSKNIQEPFQAELKAWVFPNGKFDRLVEIAEEHGDLTKMDLILGPCKNAQWQQFDIQNGAGNPEWTADNARKKFVAQILANRCEDLKSIIARTGNPGEIAISMREVTAAWETAFAKPSVTNSAVSQARSQKAKSSGITSDDAVKAFLGSVGTDDSGDEETGNDPWSVGAEDESEDESVDIGDILAQFKK